MIISDIFDHFVLHLTPTYNFCDKKVISSFFRSDKLFSGDSGSIVTRTL